MTKESACMMMCLCQKTSPKRWIWNVNLTSQCDVTNSAHPVTMTSIRHCYYCFYAEGCRFDSRFRLLRTMQHCGCNINCYVQQKVTIILSPIENSAITSYNNFPTPKISAGCGPDVSCLLVWIILCNFWLVHKILTGICLRSFKRSGI